MYEGVRMAECQKPVKLGSCMQARQGWLHIAKCLTIVTPIRTSFRHGVTMVKHFVICHHPCPACIQPPSLTGFRHSAIPTSSYILWKWFFTLVYIELVMSMNRNMQFVSQLTEQCMYVRAYMYHLQKFSRKIFLYIGTSLMPLYRLRVLEDASQ